MIRFRRKVHETGGEREWRNKMRYPKFLPGGGTIGFVAPSFGCAAEPYRTGFDAAQRKLREMGYRLDPGPNCYASCGIGISNTPENCGRELTEYYVSGENDVLISCGGGELMCETLDHVDFERIREAPPKWYMGYSDNTNMTFLLATLCDTASVYGPCISEFHMDPWHPSLVDAFGVLSGSGAQIRERRSGGAGEVYFQVHNYDGWEKDSLKDEAHPLVPFHITEPFQMRTCLGTKRTKEGLTAEGRLLGGCVDCLVNLLGTEYDRVADFNRRYGRDGVIWFLECCDLNVMGIRRAMWQMEHAGWFDCARGFLIGRPLCYGQEMMGLDAYEAVTGVVGKYGLPVWMDVDLGHLKPMMPMITGSFGKVTSGENTIRVEMTLR